MKMYDGRHLAALGDVVVVTINYRLNAFGLIVDDGLANLGIHDQQLALNWTHNQIAHFGGDPENITIFGKFTNFGNLKINLFPIIIVVCRRKCWKHISFMSNTFKSRP